MMMQLLLLMTLMLPVKSVQQWCIMTFTMLKINTYCFSLSTLRNTTVSRSTLGFNTGVVRKEEDSEIACVVQRATGYPQGDSRPDLGQAESATMMSALI